MARLDPELERKLREWRRDPTSQLGDEVIGLSVKYTGDVAKLRNCGMEVMGDAGGVAIGDIRLDKLEALAALDNIISIEAPRKYKLHLDTSVPEIHADLVRTGSPPYTGKGVIIGIIDTGIDIFHKNFRDADGDCRIVAIWDQTLVADPTTTEKPPAGFGNLGVEFDADAIQNAVDSNDDPFRHQDLDGHGTHVAGIAAGSGAQSGNCHLSNHYLGVAPDADIVMVKFFADANSANKNTDLQKAIQYLFNYAANTNPPQPMVVNLSLGHEIGPHDGTDNLDVFVDGLLNNTTGRVLVVSAGNDGDIGTADDIKNGDYRNGLHASGHIAANGTSPPIQFVIPPKDKSTDSFGIWYSGAGRLQFTLSNPSNVSMGPVAAGTGSGTATALGPDMVTINSFVNASGRNDITWNIAPPNNGSITPNTWSFTLKETSGNPVDWDCWIAGSHSDPHPVFVFGLRDNARTLNSPGTAKNVITVAAYGSKDGGLAAFSSRGPTLAPDNRQKPEISAPGCESSPSSGIMAPKSRSRSVWYCCDCCEDFYVDLQGTSMSAPHVTGAIALMLERNKNLTFDQIRAAIQQFARNPGGGVALPNNDWGFGKIDAQTAIANIPAAQSLGGGGGGGGFITSEPMPLSPPTLDGFRSAAHAEFIHFAEGRDKPPSPADISASAAEGILSPASFPIARRLCALVKRSSQSPAAQMVAALVSTHVDEVYRLVNENRRIATVWHRMGGRGLMRTALADGAGKDGNRRPILPAQVQGHPLAEYFKRMLALLGRYGSEQLRNDVIAFGPLMLGLPGSTLADICNLESGAFGDAVASGNA